MDNSKAKNSKYIMKKYTRVVQKYYKIAIGKYVAC